MIPGVQQLHVRDAVGTSPFRLLPYHINKCTGIVLSNEAKLFLTGPLTGCAVYVFRHLTSWSFMNIFFTRGGVEAYKIVCAPHPFDGSCPMYGSLDVKLFAKVEKKIMPIKDLRLLLLAFVPYRNLGKFIVM